MRRISERALHSGLARPPLDRRPCRAARPLSAGRGRHGAPRRKQGATAGRQGRGQRHLHPERLGGNQDLSGTFHAFRPDGQPIVSRSYSANLLNNGLSNDGRLAVCQACNAPESPDSSVLTVFDLVAGAVVAVWTAESGWANAYEFPEDGDRIRMVRRDRPALDYSLGGDFLDRRLWLRDEVGRGTLYVIRKALAEGEGTTSVPMDALRAGVAGALADGDARYVADAWRLLGEIEEAAGSASAALEAYDHTLRANPKIGVAKRAAP